MRTLQITKIASVFVLAFFFMIACENSGNPFGPDENNSSSTTSLFKGKGKGKGKAPKTVAGGSDDLIVFEPYAYSGSVTIKYNNLEGEYDGGSLELQDGSKLKIKEGRLVPPAGHGNKQPVKITMQVERTAEGEVVYTFGPHGTQFSKSVEITFSYANISGNGKAKLFYIEDDGQYNEQRPDQIDRKGNKMYLEVDHFSRYAVSYGR